MDKLLIKNGIIATLGEKNRVLHGHSLSISDGKIEQIAPAESFADMRFDQVIDAHNRVVLPGFINAHMHFYSSFAAGLSKAEPAHNFPEVLNNLWWRLDKRLTLVDCYHSALVACIDSIKHGTTTSIDHHASPFDLRGSLDQIARAVVESGVRASLCYEVSDRDGPRIAARGIEENVDFLRHGCDHERLHGLFGLHASFTLEDRTLARSVEAARAFDAGFHIHVAEDASDQTLTRRKHHVSVGRRLADAGVLGPKTICAHGVFLGRDERKLLRESDTILTHQPQSNMNNGVGILDLVEVMDSGQLVGLGTDAMTVNMLEELRTAVWLQRVHHRNPSVGFDQATTALIRNNAIIANRFWECGLGELSPGFAADIAILDYDPPTPLDESSFTGHLVFGMARGRVDTTIVAGKVLMSGGELVDLDEARIKARSRELAAELWKRF